MSISSRELSQSTSSEKDEDATAPRRVHDKIQIHIYIKHLKIVRLLLKNSNTYLHQEKHFDIIPHFQKSEELIIDKEERLKLAQLLLKGSQRSKLSTSYHSGFEYASFGNRLL